MHLTDQEIAAYRSQGMQPAEILRLRGHLDSCAECRAKLGDRTGDAAILRRFLEDEPDEQELTLFAAGQLPPEHAGKIAAHLKRCPKCAAVVAELAPKPVSHRSAFARWGALAAMALVAAGGLIWWRERPLPTPPPLVALNDGPRLIRLSASGDLDGLPGFDLSERKAIAEALRTGRMASAHGLPAEPPGELRSSHRDAGFQLVAPLAERLAVDRPIFRWEPLPGASSYSVKVFTEDDRIVERGETRSNEWQPAKPLPRQVRLAWQVTARQGSSLVTAPLPPAPRAIFELISAGAAARIARAQADTPPSHLGLAALYAREGMIEDARRELAALEAANPQSPVVESLLESVDNQ